jgi:aminoglycoside phosphotransferase (APT) family kinase protein
LAEPARLDLAESAGRIVRAAVGAEPARVIEIRRGIMTWKFDVAVSSEERFIVRFYPPGREGVIDYEPDLWRRCAGAGVKVPEVICDGRSGPPSPRPYVLYRRLPGATLGECWEGLDTTARRRAAVELAAALDRLHTVSVAGWGELVSAWQAREAYWEAFVAGAIDEGLAAGHAFRALSPELMETVGAIRARLDAVAPPERSGVVWADVSPDNLVIEAEGGLAGLLDFESCIGGELCSNLGYCLAAHAGSGFYEALRDAWVEDIDRNAARVELYAVVRAMVIAKFAGRGSMPAGEPRPRVEDFLPGLLPAAESLRRRLQERR